MPVQIVIAGAGLVGRRHIAAIAECEGAALRGIVEPDESGRACAADAGVAWHRSLAEMFAAGAPDGVILATPNNMHVENGLECVRAGCPLLVEKPLATTAAEGQVLVEAAAAAGVPLLVGHHRRHNPLVQKAREVIESGRLGRLRTVHAVCWLYKPDDYFEQAPWRKRRGAGPVSINLVHDVDVLRHLCGDVVCAQAQAAAAQRGYENEDAAVALLRFAGGALGTMSVSDSAVSPWSWELTAKENPVYPHTGQSCYFLAGSHGALSLPDLTVWQNDGARSWWRPMHSEALSCAAAEPLVRQIGQFAAVIAGAAPPLVSGSEGVKTLQVMEAIQRSAASGGAAVHIAPLAAAE